MISLQITDVKDFMAKLLKTDLFDHFLMPEAVITCGKPACHIGHEFLTVADHLRQRRSIWTGSAVHVDHIADKAF